MTPKLGGRLQFYRIYFRATLGSYRYCVVTVSELTPRLGLSGISPYRYLSSTNLAVLVNLAHRTMNVRPWLLTLTLVFGWLLFSERHGPQLHSIASHDIGRKFRDHIVG
jgi:hypothetical protein